MNHCLLVLLISFLLSSCGVITSIPAYTNKNSKGDSSSYFVERSSFRAIASKNHHPNVFVGISISGGGSRAATFGTAVLSELDKLGILDEVNLISSVSGGGLPSAYFALYGEDLNTENAWREMMQKMAQSFRTKLIWKALRPDNLVTTSVTDLDRSDLLMSIFDDKLFNGAAYKTLGSLGKRRPAFIANATEIGAKENRMFPFTTERLNAIGSDIGDLPISTAVVASAAFPGLLNSVTLKSWPSMKPNGVQPSNLYVHLVDGGAIDNLGISTLRAAARTVRTISDEKIFKCLLIVVDAHPAEATKEHIYQRDMRSSPIDYIFDTNIFEGIDALQTRRRYSDLDMAGINIPDASVYAAEPVYDPEWPKSSSQMSRFRYVGPRGQGGGLYGYNRVVEMKLSRYEKMNSQSNSSHFVSQQLPTGSCLVWHINLSGINSLEYDEAEIPPIPGPEGERNHPVLVYRNNLSNLLTRVGTDFNLNGPKNCSAPLIAESMFDAANILVQEDRQSLKVVCSWLKENLSVNSSVCKNEYQPYRVKELPLNYKIDKKGFSVQCAK